MIEAFFYDIAKKEKRSQEMKSSSISNKTKGIIFILLTAFGFSLMTFQVEI